MDNKMKKLAKRRLILLRILGKTIKKEIVKNRVRTIFR